jgi:hypothetical protein
MGGGNSKSVSNIDIVNNSVISAIVSAAQDCSSTVNANQQVVHSGFGLFTGTSQNVSVSLTCLQKVVVDSKLIAQMAQKIIQNVEANNGTIFGGKADSEANTKVRNYLSTRVTTTFLQNCVSSVIADQNVRYGGVQIGTFDSQSINTFQQCMTQGLNNMSVAQNLTTDTTQTAKSATTGPSLDLGLGSLFGGLGSYFYYILIFIVLVVVAYLVWTYFINSPSYSKNEKPLVV